MIDNSDRHTGLQTTWFIHVPQGPLLKARWREFFIYPQAHYVLSLSIDTSVNEIALQSQTGLA